jgi:CheY-like chemotaxis protein
VTILVAEDSRFLRLATERSLAKAGYRVITAGDGEEALRSARENRPDLVLLDMMLPKMSGIEVLQALRGDPNIANTPVIVLSGLSQKNEAKLLKAGATAYFEKSERMLEKDSAGLIHLIESVLANSNKPK